MRYQPLGKSDLKVSEISFGCMSLRTDHRYNQPLLHKAVDLGINFFDTADLYDKGFNEETVGKAFEGMRQEVIIATKVGNEWRPDGSGWDWNPSKAYIKEAVYKSLRRLKTDYIDLYQLHGGTVDDPIDETIEAFEELKKAGWIREYGISSIRPNVIREYLERSGIVSIMSQYSLLDRRPEEAILAAIHEAGVRVVVRGALAKGLLGGKEADAYLGHTRAEVANAVSALEEAVTPGRTAAQAAIRYALGHPAVATVAAGASTLAQLEENAGAGMAPPLAELRQQLQDRVPARTYENHR